VANPGNTQVGLSWAAPASDGGSPIDHYRITGPFPGSPIQTANGSVTTATISGLTNFTAYTFNVEAHNAVGYSPLAGPIPATPTPPAPTNVSGIAGDQSASVSWTAPTGPVPTGYTVTGVPGGTCTATPPATSCTVTGLTNGTTYTFTVQAAYGADTGPVSAPSAGVTPNGTFVTQIITAQRPAGTLDIAEGCFSGGTPNFGLYPETCNVDLGTGVLDASSTYYVASGAMHTVSVRDLRDSDAGWSVNTQVSAFTSGTDAFGANCLSLTPRFDEVSNSATYTQAVTVSGHVLDPVETSATGTAVGGSCTGAGLAGATVMTAAANGGLGRTDLNGALQLNIPVSADAGTYTATLTVTVI
jgi:hypothetical protein